MKRVNFILKIIGIALICCCVGLTAFFKIYTSQSAKQAESIFLEISKKLPAKTSGSVDDYSEKEMPVLQINSKDYACLLEVPDFDIGLPIQNEWNTNFLLKTPARFWGSAYDKSLVIGSNNINSNFEFCSKIDVGQKIIITDMLGTQFSYKVSKIERIKSPQFEELSNSQYALSLFSQEKLSSTYVIVRCE